MFKLIIDHAAEEQIAALPDHALRPLADLFALLETAPLEWRPVQLQEPQGEHAYARVRRTRSRHYVVLDRQREVYLVRVEWP
ncbi:hypothetical protein ACWEJ6_49980 [Nonomuraea sp. NPDC004702]